MLVDIVVRNGAIVAAKPDSDMAPPIVLMTLAPGVIIPAIKWNTATSNTLNQRISNRTYGRLYGKALDEALKIVMESGELNIAGEYGSIEIDDKDFEADSKQQNDKYETSPDFKAKECWPCSKDGLETERRDKG